MATEHSPLLPLFGVGLAVVAWGSYAAPIKSKAVAAVNLHPCVFQFYMCIGIHLASLHLLLIPEVRNSFEWTWWALLSACMWVPGNLISVVAVRELGIAAGQGVWSGTVAFVSFLWGQLYFRTGMKDPALGGLGIALLVLGIAGLGVISGGGLGGGGASSEDTIQAPLMDDALPAPVASAVAKAPPKRKLRGLVAALTVGVCAGSTMVPMRKAPEVRLDGFERSCGPLVATANCYSSELGEIASSCGSIRSRTACTRSPSLCASRSAPCPPPPSCSRPTRSRSAACRRCTWVLACCQRC